MKANRLDFVIAPDFSPKRYAGWYFFATVLQKHADLSIKLHLPTSAEEQSALLDNKQADFIYANPYDTAELIRERGYRAVAQPIDVYDEMVIVSAKSSSIDSLIAIPKQSRVAFAANKDVEMIGYRLLEPVDITEETLKKVPVGNFQSVIRRLFDGEADVGFILADSFYSLSEATRSKLHVLAESDIQDIRHAILAHGSVDKDAGLRFLKGLLSAAQTPRGKAWLTELGIPNGFKIMLKEDGEFMIDLMETLVD